MRQSSVLRVALGVLVVAAGLIASGELARACGGFFSRRTLEGPRRPALSYEKTLIVFDRERQREHFVREVAFRAASEPFGFVVPTPSRPEVASMKSPFESLEREFPFSSELGLVGIGSRGGGVALPARAPVRVLEVKRVGSFTSYVLAANDEGALTGWLAKNGFVTTPETTPWLRRYVELGFFYVAMRYEPPSGRPNLVRTNAETVRISFDTPLAYYPYAEPEPPAGSTTGAPRMLELWYVSQSRGVPVALLTKGESSTWVRPMQAGRQFSTNAPTLLKRGFGSALELLPAPPLVVQRFIDQKQSRSGFGDVLFVPDGPVNPKLDALRRFFPILDPALAAPRGATP